VIETQDTSELRTAIEAALGERTLPAAFQRIAPAFAGLPALREYGRDRVVTWDDYARRVQAAATGLHALGVRAGDTVALLLRNRPEFHVLDAAALHLGAVPFSLYHTEPVERMAALLADSGARVLVSEEFFVDRVLPLSEQAPGLDRVVIDGGDAHASERILTLAQLEELASEGFDFEQAWRAVTPDAVATLVYTSGTTGAPKAVQIPHRAIMHSIAGVEQLAPTTPGQRGVSFLPNAHISDRFICHYSTMGLGGTLTCVPDHEDLWDAIVATRPTRFHGVPRTFEKLLDRARSVIDADPQLGAALEAGYARVRAEQEGRQLDPDAAARAQEADERLAPVREHLGLDQVEWLSVAAAPSSYAVLEFHHAIGLRLAELWGMSEFMMAIMNPPSKIKLGTVGIPLPAVEARRADDGELLLRGPHACAGYRNNPEATREMLDDEGWAHSGDVVSVDEDGYITIVGRKKEQMINSSGKNLFPAKIEAALLEASPLIAYAATIADRRRYVSALIVLDPERLQEFAAERGLSGTHAELAAAPEVQAEIERAVAAGNEKLSRVEQIRAWKVLDTTWAPGGDEVTNTSKLRRKVIDEKYADEIEALYADA
jgi:long-subunit acyl-CoA synthetase (AMP-forming)